MNARLLLLALASAGILTPLHAQTAPAPTAPAAEAADPLDDYGDYDAVRVSDPFEPVNRAVFVFNDFVYEQAFWPVARGYEKTVPSDLRTGVDSFFTNLRYPVRLVGSLLQGKLTRAAQETSKFIINTTIGMGGLFRFSDNVPALVNVPAEDIGQAFGAWGIGNGPYLVVPIFGGMSTRDLFGRAGDACVYPLGWKYPEWDNQTWTQQSWEWDTGLAAADTINSLPSGMRLYRELKGSALDPYVSLRDGTISFRAEQVSR